MFYAAGRGFKPRVFWLQMAPEIYLYSIIFYNTHVGQSYKVPIYMLYTVLGPSLVIIQTQHKTYLYCIDIMPGTWCCIGIWIKCFQRINRIGLVNSVYVWLNYVVYNYMHGLYLNDIGLIKVSMYVTWTIRTIIHSIWHNMGHKITTFVILHLIHEIIFGTDLFFLWHVFVPVK